MKTILLFLLLCASPAFGETYQERMQAEKDRQSKERVVKWKVKQPIIVSGPTSYQETMQAQKAKHEQLMKQARKDRATQEARWKKEYEDSLTAPARFKAAKRKAFEDAEKQPGVIIGPVIGPFNNPFINTPPHETVKILSGLNK